MILEESDILALKALVDNAATGLIVPSKVTRAAREALIRIDSIGRGARAALDAQQAEQASDAQDAAPVAWRFRYCGEGADMSLVKWVFVEERPNPPTPNWEVQPLYAAITKDQA